MPKRYVAATPLARFLVEVFGPDINLSEIERRSTARGVKLLASSLSRYLNGDEKISTETVRRLAAFTGRPEAEIRALLPDADRPKATPDEAARELIRETVMETLAQMGHPRVAAEREPPLPTVGPYLTAAAAIDALDAAFVALPVAEQERYYTPELRKLIKATRRRVLAAEGTTG